MFLPMSCRRLHRPANYHARRLHGFFPEQKRTENVRRCPGGTRGDQDFGNKELALPHPAPHFIHGRNNRLGEERVGLDSLLQSSVRDFLGEGSFPVDDGLLQLLKNSHFRLLR